MKKIIRTLGLAIATVGFILIFGEAATPGLQILWTLGAITLFYLGYAIWTLGEEPDKQ